MSELKEKLVRKLEQLPGVSHQPWPERDDGFSTLHYGGKEIAHFHSNTEIDIRLGKQLISEHALEHPKNSATHPNRSKNSPYIELPLNCEDDLDQILTLVKLITGSKSSVQQ